MNQLANKLANKKCTLLVLYYLVLQLAVLYRNYMFDNPKLILYFSDHLPLLFAAAFFFNNIKLVKAFISFGLLAHGVWAIDFLGRIVTGAHLTGTSEYAFGFSLIPFIITIAMHSLTDSVALIFTFKERTCNVSLLYALVYVVVLFILSIVFSAPAEDINCIYNACGNEGPFFGALPALWIPLTFILVVIPGFLIQKGVCLAYHALKQ